MKKLKTCMAEVELLKNSGFRRALMACFSVQDIKNLGGKNPGEGFENSVETFVLQLEKPVTELERETKRVSEKLTFEKAD